MTDIKSLLNEPEYDVDFVDWIPEMRFTKDEACAFINYEVIRLDDKDSLPSPPISKIGLVVGVLVMNEEIELLVKFGKVMEQLVKAEFCGDYIIVPNQ